MKKAYYLSFTAFALGVLCLILYAVIGSEVSLDGILIEEFFLIPIGLLLFTSGLIMTFIISLVALLNSSKKFDKWMFGFSLASIILIGLYFFSFLYFSQHVAPAIQDKKDVKNNTYFVNNEAVTLVNGREEKMLPYLNSSQITQYFGNEVKADFNNDNFEDTAFLLTQDSGGSGTFFYVAVALGTSDGYFGTNAVLLGDRIAPQTTELHNGEIVVNYVNRAITDSFTTAPSVGVSRYFKIDSNNLVEVLK